MSQKFATDSIRISYKIHDSILNNAISAEGVG